MIPRAVVPREDGENRRAAPFQLPRGEERDGERCRFGEGVLPRREEEDFDTELRSKRLDLRRESLASVPVEDGAVVRNRADRARELRKSGDGGEGEGEEGRSRPS